MEHGTNPYGRLLSVMKHAAGTPKGLVKGEYLGDGRFSIGAHTFDEGETSILQTEATIDGWTYKMPGLEKQEHTIVRTVTDTHGKTDTIEIKVSVPPIKKGDMVAAWQFGDEEYLILGKVHGGDEE